MVNKKPEVLNPVYREISEKLGEKTAAKIYQMFKGRQISFPMRFYSPKYIRWLIPLEYDGSNIKTLAAQYGYSEKTVRRIIKEAVEKTENQDSRTDSF